MRNFSKSESQRNAGEAAGGEAGTRNKRQAKSLRKNLLKRKRQQRDRFAGRPEKAPDGN